MENIKNFVSGKKCSDDVKLNYKPFYMPVVTENAYAAAYNVELFDGSEYTNLYNIYKHQNDGITVDMFIIKNEEKILQNPLDYIVGTPEYTEKKINQECIFVTKMKLDLDRTDDIIGDSKRKTDTPNDFYNENLAENTKNVKTEPALKYSFFTPDFVFTTSSGEKIIIGFNDISSKNKLKKYSLYGMKTIDELAKDVTPSQSVGGYRKKSRKQPRKKSRKQKKTKKSRKQTRRTRRH